MNTFTNRQAFWQVITCSYNGSYVIRKQQLSNNGGRIMKETIQLVSQADYDAYIKEKENFLCRKETADISKESFFENIYKLILGHIK